METFGVQERLAKELLKKLKLVRRGVYRRTDR
jgi:hypothetical protein